MRTIGRILRKEAGAPQEELRAQSARADALLQEFESSGKGWFWRRPVTAPSPTSARALRDRSAGKART